MARRPRSSFPESGIFHISSRGVNRCAIVVDDFDRRALSSMLATLPVLAGLRCHAYVVMTNHLHLLVEGDRDAVSRAVRAIKGRYARTFNDRHGRTGPLFESRFDARVVEREDDLNEVIEYIRQNPVKAGLSATAEDWPWAGP